MLRNGKAHKVVFLLLFLIFLVSILTVEARPDHLPTFVESCLVLAVHSHVETISFTHSFMQYIRFICDEHALKDIFLLNQYDRAPPQL